MSMTRQLLYAGLTGVICLLSLLMGSGIGQAYHLSEIAMYGVIALFLLLPFGRTIGGGLVPRREFFLMLAMALVFVLWPATRGNKLHGLEYAWLLLFPYVIGQLKLSEKDVRTIGLTCGAFGFVVVAVRLGFGIFGGWNENEIAMAGFFGCAVFMVAPWDTWGMKIFQKVMLVVMTLMVLALDSRSCVIGMLILTAFGFGLLKRTPFTKKVWLRRIALLAPLLVALVTVLFQNSDLFDQLNNWSMTYFDKPVFNGRNNIWEHGFILLSEKPLLGEGWIYSGYWHNCALTVLSAFGILGYTLWILYFEFIMKDAAKFKEDACLICAIPAILTIMFQQSFELGLVSATGKMLPYLIMGIMLGRMRYLRDKKSNS